MTVPDKKPRMAAALPLSLACIIVAAALILVQQGKPGSHSVKETPASTGSNPFEYDLAELSRVDSALIGYRQESVVPIPVDDACGICVDTHDRLYVAGTGGIFMLDSAGDVLRTYGADEWMRFCAVDETGRIYAGSSRTLRRFAADGKVEKTWRADSDSSHLTSVAIDDDNIYVGDAGMKTVWRLDSSWRVVNRIGTRDSVRNIPGFILPSLHLDIAVGQDGSLWAVDAGRHSIKNFRPNGDPLGSWGAAGTGCQEFCGCCNPIRMALLRDGSFVTSEKGIVRVKVYNQAGEFVCVVAPPSAFHTIGEGLDLAVDSHSNILVLVAQEKRVRIYAKKER
jgi:hypothetical protein